MMESRLKLKNRTVDSTDGGGSVLKFFKIIIF